MPRVAPGPGRGRPDGGPPRRPPLRPFARRRGGALRGRHAPHAARDELREARVAAITRPAARPSPSWRSTAGRSPRLGGRRSWRRTRTAGPPSPPRCTSPIPASERPTQRRDELRPLRPSPPAWRGDDGPALSHELSRAALVGLGDALESAAFSDVCLWDEVRLTRWPPLAGAGGPLAHITETTLWAPLVADFHFHRYWVGYRRCTSGGPSRERWPFCSSSPSTRPTTSGSTRSGCRSAIRGSHASSGVTPFTFICASLAPPSGRPSGFSSDQATQPGASPATRSSSRGAPRRVPCSSGREAVALPGGTRRRGPGDA